MAPVPSDYPASWSIPSMANGSWRKVPGPEKDGTMIGKRALTSGMTESELMNLMGAWLRALMGNNFLT